MAAIYVSSRLSGKTGVEIAEQFGIERDAHQQRRQRDRKWKTAAADGSVSENRAAARVEFVNTMFPAALCAVIKSPIAARVSLPGLLRLATGFSQTAIADGGRISAEGGSCSERLFWGPDGTGQGYL